MAVNCCDTYGQCTQGRDCPVRTGKVLPHQLAHAAIVEANGCAAEGGNVRFAEPESLEPTRWEVVEFWVLTAVFAVLGLVIVGAIGAYIYARWLA